MNNFSFYSPTKIFFGLDEEKRIGQIIKDYGFKNILFVYGKSSIKKTGLYDTVINSLNSEGISFTELSGVEANPKVSLVRKGVEIVKDKKLDFILAVGGGSVIDTAKAISCGAYLECDPWELSMHKVTPTKALKVGVILTISAAGSELSNSCVISNEEINVKNGFNSDLIRPLFAVENPALTYSVSKYQTACGIVDIMMHTLERYLNEVDDLILTDNFALGLLKSVKEVGLTAMNNPTDYNARATLMLASSFSHNGLTGLGGNFYFTVHKLEHELSGRFDYIAHGAGLAILFPAWAMVVYEKLTAKFARFARSVMDVKTDDDKAAAIEGIKKLKAYFKSLGMPTTLEEVDVKEADFIKMAESLTKNNTVKVPGFVQLDQDLILKIFNLAK